MLLLIFNLFVVVPEPAFDPQAFKHFKKSGKEDVCLVDYNKKTIECDYKTMMECRNEYGKDKRIIVCFPRRSLKLGDE